MIPTSPSQQSSPLPLLYVPEKKVLTTCGAFGDRKMYRKMVQGVIRSTVWIGPDGRVIKHWPKVAKAADRAKKVVEEISFECNLFSLGHYAAFLRK